MRRAPPRLAILGSLPAAEIAAAWAAANAGTEVVHVTDTAPPRQWLAQVSWKGTIRPARLKRIRAGSPLRADAFLFAAAREETIHLARSYLDLMRGRPILLAPGGFALVEAVDTVVNGNAENRHAAVGQLPGFPAIGKIDADTVRIGSVKCGFPVGPRQHDDLPVLLKVFRRWFPELSASSLEETTLSNTNNLIHPADPADQRRPGREGRNLPLLSTRSVRRGIASLFTASTRSGSNSSQRSVCRRCL
jgi:hypothetical protein